MKTIWERGPSLPEFEKMYGFTKMAIEANEISPTERGCALTDARFRVGECWGVAPRCCSGR